MDQLYCYKQMPVWDAQTLPAAFLEKHNTQKGVWAKLAILRGEMEFELMNESGEATERHTFSVDHQPSFIEPEQWHRIAFCSDDLQCQLSFYRQATDYFSEQYGLSKTHSEVLEAVGLIEPGSVLDLGCGSGRNALYLSLLGFDVFASDHNANSIANLNKIIEAEKLNNIKTAIYDINEASVSAQYDWIISTVVMMFLRPERIPFVIGNMQESTAKNGYNLIVCAMETANDKEAVPFSFGFKPDELSAYYKDWKIIKYNENPGELHRTNQHGDRIKMPFATLLAQKRV